MTSLPKQGNRPCKTFGIYVLAAIMAALAVGLVAEPAVADERHGDQRRYEERVNERHWREHQRRRRIYVAPPGNEYYAPPPPVYYYPQPVAPSLNLIIPLRIH
jgi:hypothetical protein